MKPQKTSKIIHIITLLIGLCFSGLLTYAQNAPCAPKRMDVYLQVSKNDQTMHRGDSLFHAETALAATMVIVLKDTSAIAQIHLKLGTTEGGDDIMDKTFQYDVFGQFNDSSSYSRMGNRILLGLGTLYGLNAFYSQVVLENAYGSSSPATYEKKIK